MDRQARDPAPTSSSSPSAAVKGLHVVPSPQVKQSVLSGTAAIADDVWAVGFSNPNGTQEPLAEHTEDSSPARRRVRLEGGFIGS